MAATLKADCPHCSTRNQAFTLIAAYSHPGMAPKPPCLETILFRCNGCGQAVTLTTRKLRETIVPTDKMFLQLTPDYSDEVYKVERILPSAAMTGRAPDFTPPNIAGSYEQGCRAVQRGDWDAAGMVLRKSLDTSTKKLIQDAKPADLAKLVDMNLYRRIEWLHTQGKLTAELKDWAHIIRDEATMLHMMNSPTLRRPQDSSSTLPRRSSCTFSRYRE